jgi:hypothetical protein
MDAFNRPLIPKYVSTHGSQSRLANEKPTTANSHHGSYANIRTQRFYRAATTDAGGRRQVKFPPIKPIPFTPPPNEGINNLIRTIALGFLSSQTPDVKNVLELVRGRPYSRNPAKIRGIGMEPFEFKKCGVPEQD